MKSQFPAEFIKRMNQLLPDEFDLFLNSLKKSKAPVSIRFNPFKRPSSIPDNTIPVPWCNHAYMLAQRPDFTHDPFFHAGQYYVQEASSMFVAEILKQFIPEDRSVLALDLCGAPGGKTTLLSTELPTNSLIISNEPVKNRANILLENVLKWGLPNTIVSSNDPSRFEIYQNRFDLVLVDAPCSGEGLFRKSPESIQEWSVNNVQLCSARQKRILSSAAKVVKPNGILIYSTCTFSEEENEKNIAWLINEFGFVSLPIKLNSSWGITETFQNNPKLYGYRFYPHKVIGEGFFVSCLQKQEQGKAVKINTTAPPFIRTEKQLNPLLSNYLDNPEQFTFYTKNKKDNFAILKLHETNFIDFASNLYIKSAGIPMGILKGKELVPHEGLALSIYLSKKLTAIVLSHSEALYYLKKQNFELKKSDILGWTIAKYKDLSLGWLKILPERFNNYFPVEWRIRKQ
ncbi:MAG: RNA methyltransferase [Sphingobacteriales bacterium]|nr:MAG: RNA methyltransferase [Sphingobacteriales bacterium]